MLLARSHFLPLGVKQYNKKIIHGIPTIPKTINAPIKNLPFIYFKTFVEFSYALETIYLCFGKLQYCLQLQQ